jgi:hypothetical protein
MRLVLFETDTGANTRMSKRSRIEFGRCPAGTRNGYAPRRAQDAGQRNETVTRRVAAGLPYPRTPFSV